MTPGDVVLIYNNGRIRFAGEIAAKVRNRDLARYFWREDEGGSTWELMYFIVTEEKTDVPLEKLNPLFGWGSAQLRREGSESPPTANPASFTNSRRLSFMWPSSYPAPLCRGNCDPFRTASTVVRKAITLRTPR